MDKISKHISLIPGLNLGKYPYCHSLLIEDETTVIIDPASDPEFLKSLAQDKKVDVIILSHYHEDHFWFSYVFPEAELWIQEQDAPAMESLDRLLDEYQMYGERREMWRKILKEHYHYEPRAVSRKLKEGEKISLGKTEMVVLHTPGHTPGHSCFEFPDEKVIYLADIDLTKFGPYYGDRGSDIDQTIQSVKRVAGIKDRTFIVSHEHAIYHGAIAKEAERYLAVIEQRENQLCEILRKPKTIEEIVAERIIYKKPREPKDFYEFGEQQMISKHLERLLRTERVIIENDHYQLKQ